jgi:hypothetical protein
MRIISLASGLALALAIWAYDRPADAQVAPVCPDGYYLATDGQCYPGQPPVYPPPIYDDAPAVFEPPVIFDGFGIGIGIGGGGYGGGYGGRGYGGGGHGGNRSNAARSAPAGGDRHRH